MRRYSCVLAAAVLMTAVAPCSFAADNELTDEEKAEGWILLFNGKDHTGWKCNNGKPIATPVEDGCLLPYKSGGYIIAYTEQKFGDFKLKCDVKCSPPECNSGIFFRVANLLNPVYSGFEVAIDTPKGTGYHDFGAIYDLAKPTKDVRDDPFGWNNVELTCKGPEIHVAVNGQEVTSMNCDEFSEKGKRPDGTDHKFGSVVQKLARKGYVGLQDHGSKCWYKNIKLLELKD